MDVRGAANSTSRSLLAPLALVGSPSRLSTDSETCYLRSNPLSNALTGVHTQLESEDPNLDEVCHFRHASRELAQCGVLKTSDGFAPNSRPSATPTLNLTKAGSSLSSKTLRDTQTKHCVTNVVQEDDEAAHFKNIPCRYNSASAPPPLAPPSPRCSTTLDVRQSRRSRSLSPLSGARTSSRPEPCGANDCRERESGLLLREATRCVRPNSADSARSPVSSVTPLSKSPSQHGFARLMSPFASDSISATYPPTEPYDSNMCHQLGDTPFDDFDDMGHVEASRAGYASKCAFRSLSLASEQSSSGSDDSDHASQGRCDSDADDAVSDDGSVSEYFQSFIFLRSTFVRAVTSVCIMFSVRPTVVRLLTLEVKGRRVAAVIRITSLKVRAIQRRMDTPAMTGG